MHFGLALPGRGALARPDALVTLARRAEALAYSSLFVTDHVIVPTAYDSTYPYSESGRVASDWSQGYLEPLALMSFLAGVTSRIQLGTSVLVVPYRNPVVTAKMLATLDVMSGGRVLLGAGVGWLREEFEALAAPPFDERGAATDEYIQLMRACWTKEPVEWKGKYYRLASVSVLPKPAQTGGIPIWVGGHTDVALRRVGQLADGWHPIGQRPPARIDAAEYRRMVEVIHGWARKAGRDPAQITLSYRVPLEIRPARAKAPAGERQLFRGTAAEVVADIRAFQSIGVTHFVFDLAAPDLRQQLALLERFAEDVRPAVAGRRGGGAKRAVSTRGRRSGRASRGRR